jgi:hypothetical protein
MFSRPRRRILIKMKLAASKHTTNVMLKIKTQNIVDRA